MCPLTVDYSWGYTMPCKKHYSYTWTKGYGSDRLNAGGYADGRQVFPKQKDIKKQPMFTCLQTKEYCY
jgi:hypothetical protein